MTDRPAKSAFGMFLDRRLYSASPIEREAFQHDDQYLEALLDLMSEQLDEGQPAKSHFTHTREDIPSANQKHSVRVFDSADGIWEDLHGIDRLIAPLSVEDFFSEQYTERIPVLFRGPAQRFETLLQWDELNQLIYGREPVGNQLVLIHNGKRIDADLYSFSDPGTAYRLTGPSTSRVDGRKLQNFLRLGATLILNGINLTHERVRLFIEEVSRSLQAYAHANLYATWKPSQGFNTHWDNHDVFVMQLNGVKEWRLFGESRTSPTPLDTKPNLDRPEEEIWVGELTPGDVLYIPRGWWHEASVTEVNQDKACIHLTVSFRPVTGLNFLLWLEKLLLQNEHFRVNVPIFASEHDRKDYFARLLTLIRQELDRDIGTDFLNSLSRSWISNPATTLSEYVEPWDDPEWEQYVLRLETASDWHPELTDGGKAFYVAANAVEYKIDAYAFDLVRIWVENQPVRVTDLRQRSSEKYDTSFVDDFVKQMVRNRLASATRG